VSNSRSKEMEKRLALLLTETRIYIREGERQPRLWVDKRHPYPVSLRNGILSAAMHLTALDPEYSSLLASWYSKDRQLRMPPRMPAKKRGKK